MVTLTQGAGPLIETRVICQFGCGVDLCSWPRASVTFRCWCLAPDTHTSKARQLLVLVLPPGVFVGIKCNGLSVRSDPYSGYQSGWIYGCITLTGSCSKIFL